MQQPPHYVLLHLFFPIAQCLCRNPTLRECEDETHTPKIRTWESSETLEISKFDYRGQNTLHLDVFYIIRELAKCRCRKWACMGHLDICSTSYGKKKGQESNWQFDSRPLKVKNQPDFGACRWNVTHRWKAFEKNYKFVSDLFAIGGLSKELWPRKVLEVQTGTVSDSSLGVPEQKAIRMWVSWRGTKYIIWGKVVVSPESGPWWVMWV
jgi:hypothetical protein